MTVPEGGLGAVALGPEDAARLVTAVKAQLRSGSTGEDTLIEGLGRTALGVAEHFTGAAMIAREMQMVLPASQRWRQLPCRGVRTISEVAALAADAAAADLSSGAYAIDIDAAGIGWVRVTAPLAETRIRITFVAGLAAEWDTLPAPLRQGVVLLAAHLFEGRGGDAPPAAVAALWRPWRPLRLNAARRPA